MGGSAPRIHTHQQPGIMTWPGTIVARPPSGRRRRYPAFRPPARGKLPKPLRKIEALSRATPVIARARARLGAAAACRRKKGDFLVPLTRTRCSGEDISEHKGQAGGPVGLDLLWVACVRPACPRRPGFQNARFLTISSAARLRGDCGHIRRQPGQASAWLRRARRILRTGSTNTKVGSLHPRAFT